jgi:hypothetical protein
LQPSDRDRGGLVQGAVRDLADNGRECGAVHRLGRSLGRRSLRKTGTAQPASRALQAATVCRIVATRRRRLAPARSPSRRPSGQLQIGWPVFHHPYQRP